MLTKFVNVFDNCKLQIRKHYLVSLSYVLLHLLTLRLFDNPAPAFFFADNGLLMANSQKQAEQLLDVMRDAAGRCGLEMNAMKSK